MGSLITETLGDEPAPAVRTVPGDICTEPTCAYCDRPIEGPVMSVMGRALHPACHEQFEREYNEFEREVLFPEGDLAHAWRAYHAHV